MRRLLAVAITGAIALVLGLVMSARPDAALPQVGPSALETQSFQLVGAPPAAAVPAEPRPAPAPRFSRTSHASVELAKSVPLIDACDGPVVITLGPTRPVLMVEHDYCGGSAWIPRLDMGDAVKLGGKGVKSGIYVVTEIRFQTRLKARVSDLPSTDVVLQTCLEQDSNKIVLVGLEKFDPSAPV